MSGYLYETHLHTNKGSLCGKSAGNEYIQFYIDNGYSGLIVTDHFFRGNTAVPKELPWKDRIDLYCKGYEEARNEGERRGFSVFFGWEERIGWDEYLIYGLDKQFLLDHPEMENWTRLEQFEQVHAAGGCVVQAHPFRAAWYMSDIHLSAGCVDAIEAINSGNQPQWNSLAIRYGQLLDVPMTAGSDNHDVQSRTPEQLTGVILEKPLGSIHDYVSTILERKPIKLRVPEGIPAWQPGMEPELPAVLHGEGDRFITDQVRDFLDGKPFSGVRG